MASRKSSSSSSSSGVAKRRDAPGVRSDACRAEIRELRRKSGATAALCHSQAALLRWWAAQADREWPDFVAAYRDALRDQGSVGQRAKQPHGQHSSPSGRSSPTGTSAAGGFAQGKFDQAAYTREIVQFLEHHRPTGMLLGREYVLAGLTELMSRLTHSCDLQTAVLDANLRIATIRCNALSPSTTGNSAPSEPTNPTAAPRALSPHTPTAPVSVSTTRTRVDRAKTPSSSSSSSSSSLPPLPHVAPPLPPKRRRKASKHVYVHTQSLDRAHAEARFAEYVTTRVLGKGGFGTVHEACKVSDAADRCLDCSSSISSSSSSSSSGGGGGGGGGGAGGEQKRRCPYAIKVTDITNDVDGIAEDAARRDVLYLNKFAERRVDGRRIVPRIYDAWMQTRPGGSGLAQVLGETRYFYVVMERFDGDMRHLAQRRGTLRMLAIVNARAQVSPTSVSSSESSGSEGKNESDSEARGGNGGGDLERGLPLAVSGIYDASELRRMFRIAAQLGRRDGDIKADQFLYREATASETLATTTAATTATIDTATVDTARGADFDAVGALMITDFGFVGTGNGNGDADEEPEAEENADGEISEKSRRGGEGKGEAKTERRRRAGPRREPVALWGWPGNDGVRELQCPAPFSLLTGDPAYVNVLLLEAAFYVMRPILVRVPPPVGLLRWPREAPSSRTTRRSGAPTLEPFVGVRDLDRDQPGENLCRNYDNRRNRAWRAEISRSAWTLAWSDLLLPTATATTTTTTAAANVIRPRK